MNSLARLIPGYAEALEAEARVRNAPYLNLPRVLCGVAVRPLTLRDYTRLCDLRSPFVYGGDPDRADIGLLIWAQRECPQPEDSREVFCRDLDALDLGEMTEAVGSFLDEALMDAPAGGGAGAPYYSLASAMVHTLRSAYVGTTRDDVLDMDIRELWQAYRNIVRENDPTAILFNTISDRVKGDWQRAQRREWEARQAAAQTS